MIILDANVLIGFLDADDPHHDAAIDLLERRYVDGYGASVLTVAEALVHPTRVGRQADAVEAFDAIGLRVVELASSDAAVLARIRTEYRLKMPDAVALSTAMSCGSELASFDDALRAAALKAGITVTS